MESSFNEILKNQWELLIQASLDRKQEWHTPSLANIVNGEPENRTVVLRSADPDTRILTCHVDLRSNKLEKLASENKSHSL